MRTKNTGFTLMEMLISITIFMLFLGIAAGSYTTLVSANSKASAMQKLYREVRFVFDILAQEIRAGNLDYSCVGITLNPDSLCLANQNSPQKRVLALIHKNGEKRTLFKFDERSKKLFLLRQDQVNNNNIPSWTGVDWKPLFSETFPLEDVSFGIFPLKDPYELSEDNAIQWQPSVRIDLRAQGFHFRTTYSSRTYGKF